MTNGKKTTVAKKKTRSKRTGTVSKTINKAAVKKNRTTTKKNSPQKPRVNGSSSKEIQNQTLVLNPVLVINNAKTLLKDFNQLLKRSGDINIDVSAVEMVDTAILQLLLAVTNKAKTSKQKVKWIKPSKNFISNITLLGLSESLGLPKN